jgi:hypothetical protein
VEKVDQRLELVLWLLRVEDETFDIETIEEHLDAISLDNIISKDHQFSLDDG